MDKTITGDAFSAGRSAYLALIDISSNPYRTSPFREAWDKGYKTIRSEREPRPVPTANTGTRPYKGRNNGNNNRDRSYLTPGRVDRFNDRNRTRAY